MDMTEFTAKHKQRSLYVLAFFWFFTGVEYAVILPSAWLYLQHLGADHKFWLSASISAFSLANFVFSPIYGRIADRFSTRSILIISNCFEIVGNLLYLVANDTYSNVEARFIAGMGAAAGAAIFAFIIRCASSPMEVNSNMGWIMTARAVGLIVGPAFNFLLVKVDFHIGALHVTPLNSPGLLMLIVWIICQILCVFVFKDMPSAPVTRNLNVIAEDKPSAPEEEDSPRCSEYLNLGVISLLLVQFLNMFNQTAYETFLTPFTLATFHWKQTANSISFIATAVLAIGTYYTMIRIQRKYNIADRIEITIGITLQLVGFFLFWLMPSHDTGDVWKFIFSSVIFVIGLPFVYIAPALQAKLTTKRAQGLGQGIRRSVVSAAQIIGPLWATLSDHRDAFWGGMVGLTAFSLVVLALSWKQIKFVMPTLPNSAPTTPSKAKGEKAPLLVHEEDDSTPDHSLVRDFRRGSIN
ncbi:uncharacterized protein MONBRDRAFT_31978 [Monosiga brevicollis MX1]|uniref:Major facilitator superfamily (MFS) profile domain-containing protein n=1 Tax=Monosiga brevicollis TaxID=81824 RepID=A9UWL1_MONBE|nr:uncharacterized protein MONBRDRAFT_31978 [Monosiga brevicollis MX1]EDQ90232.1 predicted protein [Monosiga brevicollis MX1]|eukprot:XP_001744999.1 hypothetical protein [Monosiga brevicollis MX1]